MKGMINFPIKLPLTACLISIFLLALHVKTGYAQQMIVDDAAITTHRSIQVETWYGTQESWFQPAIGATSWLEIGPGIIFNSSDGFVASNWLVEFKAVWGDHEVNGLSWGVVAAPVYDFDGILEEFYSYLPVTAEFGDGFSVLHLNLGVEGVRPDESADMEYAFTTGIRGDFVLTNRVALLSELFTSDFETPSFQAGLRFTLIPDRLEMDITYGEGIRQGMDYPGFNVGIAITPDRLW